MRVRKRKGASALIAAHPTLVLQTACDWEQVFWNKEADLHIEVGCGKGDFIIAMAARYPEVNFVGIEIQESVLSYALDKLLESGLSNVRLLLVNGKDLTNYFKAASVAQLYLNFSDPWPKKRHEKRRLTSPDFLKLYKMVLKPSGTLTFKTDNRGLFEYSLLSLTHYGLELSAISLDLHREKEMAAENVETEYERKFSKKGPIYRLTARFNQNEVSKMSS
jgi:tRNA (guanine-N7-)-methyltransferase